MFTRDDLRRLLFSRGTATRFTQDFPVLPDVWIAFAEQAPAIPLPSGTPRIRRPVDLLITPDQSQSGSKAAFELAAYLHKALKSDQARHPEWPHAEIKSRQLACHHFAVTVRMDFDELVRVVLPRTKRWQEEIGRALAGLGVSACLMASFKAFVIWFPPLRLPAVNGWIMATGGLGALAATAPVEAALRITDWRGLFLGLSIATWVIAAAVFWVVPERSGRTVGGTLWEQWQGVGSIFRSRLFWQIAPLTVLSQATFMAIQGLWAGPWLRDVAGLERSTMANYLLLIAAAMVAGYLSMGTLAVWLNRFGIRPLSVAAGGMLLFMLTQLAIVLVWTTTVLPLWMLFGFFGTSGIVTYAALSQQFPPWLAGRVNTALNLLVFIAAFVGQWSIGTIIGRWSQEDGYALPGYQAAFGIALALQAAAFVWLLLGSRQTTGGKT
jgi:predicted MFS family arabinose efflux permease